MIKAKSVQDFLTQLASANATPGGGSAAAISGAMGAALLSMVANLTIGKKAYQAVANDMQAQLTETEKLRSKLTEMIEQDVTVFNEVMAAYGMDKATEQEQAARSAAIQAALIAAAEVSLQCARLCREVINLTEFIAKHGNRNVISDAGVALLSGYAGLKSAALNVYINIGAIKDTAFVDHCNTELAALLKGSDEKTDVLYELVKQRL